MNFGSRNLRTASLSTGELVSLVAAHLAKIEIGDKALQLLKLLLARELCHLQYGHDVVLHAELAEYARLLREVADAGAGTLIYGIVGDVMLVKEDMTGVRDDKSCRHIERCGLSSSVRTEQTNNLSLTHVYRHVVDNRTLAVTLDKSLGAEHHAMRALF